MSYVLKYFFNGQFNSEFEFEDMNSIVEHLHDVKRDVTESQNPSFADSVYFYDRDGALLVTAMNRNEYDGFDNTMGEWQVFDDDNSVRVDMTWDKVQKAYDNLSVVHSVYYAEKDDEGIRHKVADVYTIHLTDEDAEKVGAYHNNGVKGEICYLEYVDGHQQVDIGVAANDKYICSYSDLNYSENEFTKNQINYACDLIEKRMIEKLHNEDFCLDESVIENIKFMADDIKPCCSTEHYMMFYTGPGYSDVSTDVVKNLGSRKDMTNVYWATDSPMYKHLYNGDTFVVYDNIENLPEDMQHDAEYELAKTNNKFKSMKASNDNVSKERGDEFAFNEQDYGDDLPFPMK